MSFQSWPGSPPAPRRETRKASCGSETFFGSTQAVAVIEVRNKGSEPAVYRVIVAFETTDGRTPYGQAIVIAGPVAATRTARERSFFGPEVPERAQLRCRIVDTLRATGS